MRRVGPPPDHILTTEVDGDLGLYDPVREQVAILNRTASDIWELCDGTRTITGIARELAAAYSEDLNQIREEVEATIRSFRESGFLEGTP